MIKSNKKMDENIRKYDLLLAMMRDVQVYFLIAPSEKMAGYLSK